MKDVKITFEDGTYTKDVIPESQEDVIKLLLQYPIVCVEYNEKIKKNVIQILEREFVFTKIDEDDKEDWLCEIDAHGYLEPICKQLFTAYLLLREMAGETK